MTEARPEDWTKLDRIRYLLDHWQDIWDAGVTSTWATFTGISRVTTGSHSPTPLPRMAHHPTIRKIERALTTLADCEPVKVRHLKAYRCNAEWRCKDQLVLVRLPSGKHDLVERRVRDKIVPRWVNLNYVTEAEQLLTKLVSGHAEIPPDLWKALTKA